MEKALVDYIVAQRAEADAFMDTPGNWMGKLPTPEDTQYWSDRVPSGTLREFQRQELVETAYYITADRTSKSYARTLEFHKWTDEKIEAHIERMCA